MGTRLLSYLDDGESQALTSFLVEVLGLEEAIRIALTRFYAHPDRQELFAERFLDRMTLGTAVDRLQPALDHFGVPEKHRQWLREVVEVRNLVAHALPKWGAEDDHLDPEEPPTYHVWERKKGEPLRVEDIEPYTVMAFKLRAMISTVRWDQPPGSDQFGDATSTLQRE